MWTLGCFGPGSFISAIEESNRVQTFGELLDTNHVGSQGKLRFFRFAFHSFYLIADAPDHDSFDRLYCVRHRQGRTSNIE